MPKSVRKKPSPKAVTTSFGPRLKQPKPVLATSLWVAGLLHLIASLDYRADQPGWFEGIARRTSDFGPLNLIGKLGADIAYLTLLNIGLVAWLLPLLLFQFAFLLYRRRPHQVTWLHGIGAGMLLTAGTAFFDFAELHFWPALRSSLPEDYVPNGLGGGIGNALHQGLLGEFIGPVGSGIILTVLLLGALYLSFRNSANGLARLIARIRIRLPRLPKRSPRVKTKPIKTDRSRSTEDFDLDEEQPLPTPMQVKRKWLSPLIGKSIVDEDPESLKSPLQFEESNKPNEAYLEALGKPIPVPSPLATRGKTRPKSNARMIPEDPVPPQSPTHSAPPAPEPSAFAAESARVTIIESEKAERDRMVPPKKRGKYKFPPIELLEVSDELPPDATTDHQAVAERLRSTLEDFKIKVELGEVHIGPVITRYDLHPAPGVRVEKIAALEKNLTMALQAQSVRILAPVPGKGCVGIEIPNRNPQSVRVRDILETRVWTASKAEIPIVLGKDVSGKPLVTDLTRMPHLLIAGSTGSGKTVCINAVICSLLYHSSPEDVRFIMVDPKIVEMKIFNDLPHMLIPVVTDPKRVPNALKWLISEMENRYQIFAKAGVRNIAGFNAKILKNQEARAKAKHMDADLTAEERAAVSQIEIPRDDDALEIPEKKLPYIVCIIDELADLMMVAPADIETCIARLAQLARAAGIHLIIATQRPSVNVITGVIKANLPSRISFKVASKVDSRTILDGGGADTLIGRGDMLFIPPGIHHLIRAQGAFVSDEEIAEIVEFLKVNGPPEILEDIQKQIDRDPDDDGGPTTSADSEDWGDAMVPDAIEVLRSTKRASTSMLQRRLRIGYNRAARIMEILEERGIVGPDNGSQPREILTDLNDF
ncbi:MAG: DNA translocase FtsK [Puniceicoccaceae bacterium]